MSLDLTSTSSLLAAMSVASERLVEFLKGFLTWMGSWSPKLAWLGFLNKEDPIPERESLRKALVQLLAVIAGVTTAFLAKSVVPEALKDLTDGRIFALGLLSSGGSGLWNSFVTYASKLKEIKKIEVEDKKKNLNAGGGDAPAKAAMGT
jgi:hypothetical protein